MAWLFCGPKAVPPYYPFSLPICYFLAKYLLAIPLHACMHMKAILH